VNLTNVLWYAAFPFFSLVPFPALSLALNYG
jgi:hypothetical protein